ncbi:molybdotransferase-like divisome protein Glp [Microlunatus antarcticus]|uniref:Molybdopterin molybdenumtransferase n=1 Tax=Microlunatus antarcticus TaxID=53388 RepID=A0A7W5JYC4_9ACTN|nr:gephyrin-like molybdotransferase Glp [Microlunatus antarcticus]MBB3328621.1 molybdopterin molybdotransferase [Microlunatus antarcticus]
MPLFGRKKNDEALRHVPEVAVLPEPPAPGPDGLRTLDQHRDYLLGCVEELMPFGQHVLDSLGLSICEDVVSDLDLPRFDNSAMDGYAVRAADVQYATDLRPVRLPVVGEVPAGGAAPHRLSPGTVMKIMTGAPVPGDADAIVPYEATDRGSADVTVTVPSTVGQHIRRRGEDVAEGETILAAGSRIGVRDVGLLTAVGIDKVMVRPRPRVVVISTGSELVDPGLPLSPEQIYDSNSYLIAAAAKDAGAQVFRVGHVGDDPAALKQLVYDQLVRADLIVTTGGVSQGDYDIVKAVLPELGATDFAGVAMQPGKPQGFGLIGEDRTPIVMLPGNPVSAFVSFEAFVRPVIRKLMGITPYVRPGVRATAAHAMSSVRGRTQLARGVVTSDETGARSVELVGGHGSHLLGDLAKADALVVLPADVDFVAAGTELEVWPLDQPR